MTSVERLLTNAAEPTGRPLSSRARQAQRSLENYLKSGVRPRWMERIADIDLGVARERRRIEVAYNGLRRDCGDDAGEFARRWRAFAASCTFGKLNELIRQHNDWYPIERDLPMDPRTGDYVPIHGRSYRRQELDEMWILERFPADTGG
jgi:hypothetical protein